MKKVFIYSLYILFNFAVVELAFQIIKPELPYQYVPQDVEIKHFTESDSAEFTLKKNFEGRFYYSNAPFDSVVKTNSLGMRDDELDDREKILTLGDSFIFGFGVNNSQTIPAQLESMSGAHIDFLNVGYSAGRSPDSYLTWLKKNKQFQGINSLLFIYENDFYDFNTNYCNDHNGQVVSILDESCSKIHSRSTFIADGRLLQYKGTIFEYLPSDIFIYLKKSYVVGIVRTFMGLLINDREYLAKNTIDQAPKSQKNEFCNTLYEIDELTDRMVVFSVPPRGALDKKLAFYDYVGTCLDQRGIKFYQIPGLEDKYYWKFDAHFNAEGTKKYSAMVYELLKQEKLVN